KEVVSPVLAATLPAVVVCFPVTFLYGVSRYLFTALAIAVVLSLFASYAVAMTVVPLFCAKLLKRHAEPVPEEEPEAGQGAGCGPGGPPHQGGFNQWFGRNFNSILDGYDRLVGLSLLRPVSVVAGLTGVFVLSLSIYPLLGVSFFPRTDASQFVVNLKSPSGSRLEVTEGDVERAEKIIREVVQKEDLGMI